MTNQYDLEFHHIGCLTEDIELSKKTYQTGLGLAECSATFSIASQKVKVCFIKNGGNNYIELVEPMEGNKALKKMLANKTVFYHLGYLTTSFDETVNQMLANGFYLINKFNSEAFSNKLCAFLYSPEMHLIEIIQK